MRTMNLKFVLAVFLVLFSLAFFSSIVSSQTKGCCLETKDGNFCQGNTASTRCVEGKLNESADSCQDGNPHGGRCNLVCQIDEENQVCTKNVPEVSANKQGLDTDPDASCNTGLCRPGCCIENGMGNWMMNEFKCSSGDFRPKSEDMNISVCTSWKDRSQTGACMPPAGECRHDDRKNCEGDFYPDKQCSDLDDSFCEPESSRTCNNGDIYYNDSCGNLGDLAEECDGNTYCSINSSGQPECKSFECDLSEAGFDSNKVLENGESVCYYEGPAGNGVDPPGSQHYKVRCEKGNVVKDLCGSGNPSVGRSEVCIQDVEKGSVSGVDKRKAYCVDNNANSCYEIGKKIRDTSLDMVDSSDNNYGEKLEDQRESLRSSLSRCKSNPVCMLGSEPKTDNGASIMDSTLIPGSEKNVGGWIEKVGSTESLIGTFLRSDDLTMRSEAFCVPRFPIGKKDTCQAASMTCDAIISKESGGGWNCDADPGVPGESDPNNCECLNRRTFMEMNNYCASAGDCGLTVNVEDVENSEFELDNNADYESKVADDTVNRAESMISEHLNLWTFENGGSKGKFAEVVSGLAYPEDVSGSSSSLKQVIFLNKSNYDFSRDGPTGNIDVLEIISDAFGTSLPEAGKVRGAYEGLYQGHNRPVKGLEGGSGDDTRHATVNYNCRPYEAKSTEESGIDCQEKCSEGPTDCTAYKCENLASDCQAINEGEEGNVLCVKNDSDDTNPPKINSIELLEDGGPVSLEKEGDVSWVLDQPLTERSEVEFNITLDEPGTCKFEFGTTEDPYNDMDGKYPEMKSLYQIEPTITPKLDHFAEVSDGSYIPGDTISRNITLKCEDYTSNSNSQVKSRYINYDLKAAEDENPPIFQSFEPQNNKDWEYNPKNYSLEIVLDDRSRVQCKYDYSSVSGYSQASKEFNCSKKIAGEPVSCSTNVSKTSKGSHEMSIYCKDTSSNENVADREKYEYNITRDIPFEKYKRKHGLKIGNITANYEYQGRSQKAFDGGNLTTSERNPEIEFSFETFNGTDSGDAVCSYSTSNMNYDSEFGSRSNDHNLVFDLVTAPDSFEVNFECDDGVSSHERNISFDLFYDSKGPEIVENTTEEGGDLKVTTDEPAQCSYTHTSCGFSFDEGSPIWEGGENSFTRNQSTRWIPSRPYYVRCRDPYGNQNCGSINSASVINGPEISRIWEESGDLRVKTDREAKCYYKFESCGFDISDDPENSMTVGGNSVNHVTDWNPSNTYHIKCKDQWGNPNPSCAAIVQPHSLQ